MTLKLDRKIKLSEVPMSYVDTLWKVLVEEFNLPPLTAIIKKIIPGSLIIIWLVPLQVSTVIAASYSKVVRSYQQQSIAKVELDDCILCDEKWSVSDIIVGLSVQDLLWICPCSHPTGWAITPPFSPPSPIACILDLQYLHFFS